MSSSADQSAQTAVNTEPSASSNARTPEPEGASGELKPIKYSALIVMMLLSFVLVTAEFLPGGMLTEMADSLGVTPGQAGQFVTATAISGLLAAPTVGLIFPRLDRRTLLIWMALAASASNLIVAIAPNMPLLLAARFLLGFTISAYWSMSISVAASIAGPERLGRAVAFNSAGASLATVAGVPIGVMLSGLLDWRAVFAIAAAATALLGAAVWWSLPKVPAAKASSVRILVDTLMRPGFGVGLIGHLLVIVGHFVGYTYIRLALERIPDTDALVIVWLLAAYGVGGLIGNFVISLIIDKTFAVASVIVPLVIAAAMATMVVLQPSAIAAAIIIGLWGFVFSSWIIVVNTWVGHRLPDRLEAGGALVVTGFQAGIAIAAAAGGTLVDVLDIPTVYLLGAALLVVGAALFAVANRISQRRPDAI